MPYKLEVLRVDRCLPSDLRTNIEPSTKRHENGPYDMVTHPLEGTLASVLWVRTWIQSSGH
jgi:hypothetical protein